jgi:hypothetical protein
MKKLLVTILLVLPFCLFAQQRVTLSYDWKKTEGAIPMMNLNVNLEDKWHIFAYDAGGDGMAINTVIKVNCFNDKGKLIKTLELKDVDANVKPSEHEYEGMGKVRWFETDYFYIVAMPPGTVKAVVKMDYQSCNDVMCERPTDATITCTVPK